MLKRIISIWLIAATASFADNIGDYTNARSALTSASGSELFLIIDDDAGLTSRKLTINNLWDLAADLDTNGEITADKVGTAELSDGSDTPAENDFVRVSSTTTVLKYDGATDVEANLEAVLDLQDLQGAVTDAQVPDTITIGAGASVTITASEISDQNAGTDITADLEEETHGTEHDGTDGDYIKDSGDTYTGVHDAGGADSFELPQSATPTTDATGEIALDTTITDHQPLWQYEAATTQDMTIIAIDTSELPALDNEIVKYDAATDKFVLEADAGSAPGTDSIGTDELDDDANTPTAGDFVVVETGAASFDYVTPNAGTDVTTDLTEESIWDAQSLVIAVTDNNPVVQTLSASQFVARASTGNVTAVTAISPFVIQSGQAGIAANGINATHIDETAIYTWSGASLISGVHEVQDDIDFNFGNDADWSIQYDEAVDNQLLIETTNTSAVATTDPMMLILVGTTPTADQDVWGVAKGTQASHTKLLTVDEDGDVDAPGTITGGTLVGSLDADEIAGDTSDDDDLDVAAGGTGVSSLTDGGILLGSGTGDITALGVATNGQIPIGDGTTDPVLATITGDDGITITNGAGTIEIDVTPVASGSDGDSSTSQSDSGLEIVGNELTLLRGCADNEILKWDETQDDWNCEADGGGGSDSNAEKLYSWHGLSLKCNAANDNCPAPFKAAGTNIDVTGLGYDDTTVECAGGTFKLPADLSATGADNVTFTVESYAETAHATVNTVCWEFRWHDVNEGDDWDAALTTEAATCDDTPGTQDQTMVTSWTETLTNLTGWSAGDIINFQFCRNTAGSDDLVDDARALNFSVSIPRE